MRGRGRPRARGTPSRSCPRRARPCRWSSARSARRRCFWRPISSRRRRGLFGAVSAACHSASASQKPPRRPMALSFPRSRPSPRSTQPLEPTYKRPLKTCMETTDVAICPRPAPCVTIGREADVVDRAPPCGRRRSRPRGRPSPRRARAAVDIRLEDGQRARRQLLELRSPRAPGLADLEDRAVAGEPGDRGRVQAAVQDLHRAEADRPEDAVGHADDHVARGRGPEVPAVGGGQEARGMGAP